jgi:hypothetical protein
MGAKPLFALAAVALALVGLHALLTVEPVQVRVLNPTTSRVIFQVDDASYLINSGGGADTSSSGRFTHQIRVLTDRCVQLGVLDASAGETILVTVDASMSITFETGVALLQGREPVGLVAQAAGTCPANISIEIVLRNGLLALGAVSAVVAFALLVRQRLAQG